MCELLSDTATSVSDDMTLQCRVKGGAMRWSAWSPENACRLQVPHGQRSHARVAVADGGHCSSQKLEERAEHERTACRAARNGASCAAPTRQLALRLLAAASLRAPRAHRAFLCAIAFDAGGGVCFLVLPPSGGRSNPVPTTAANKPRSMLDVVSALANVRAACRACIGDRARQPARELRDWRADRSHVASCAQCTGH